MQWNIPELCFCSNNTLTLQFCSPFSTLHYSRSFYIALCTLHFVLCTLHFALCTLHFAFCTLHCSRYFCNVLGTLHLFQTLLYPSYYFALFQNTLVYPLYYILLYLKHSYVSVRHHRSLTGYVFKIGNMAITWNTRKQPMVALLTMEAEYMAVTTVTCKAIWL